MKFRWYVAIGLLISAGIGSAAAADEPEPGVLFDPLALQDIADLKTQLNSGLRCRRPEEFEFVNLVVQLVDNLQLSEELVKGTFQWARKKKPYPFPYFERALRERAAEGGVAIP